MNYYIFFQEKRLGPYTVENLIALKLPASTPVWTDGMTEWSTLGELYLEGYSNSFDHSTPKNNDHQHTNNSPTGSANIKMTYYSSYFRIAMILSVSLLLIFGVVYFINANQSSTEVNTIDSLAYDSTSIPVKPNESPSQNPETSNPLPNKDVVTKDESLYYRENWPDFISSSNNAYLYSELGGISNLEISLNNNTPYILDEVIVIVDYIKANGSVFKTETLYFTNVEPNSISSLSAPDSPRGTSVNHYVIGVQSIGMKLHYPH
jgi:hypothetical protein